MSIILMDPKSTSAPITPLLLPVALPMIFTLSIIGCFRGFRSATLNHGTNKRANDIDQDASGLLNERAGLSALEIHLLSPIGLICLVAAFVAHTFERYWLPHRIDHAPLQDLQTTSQFGVCKTKSSYEDANLEIPTVMEQHREGEEAQIPTDQTSPQPTNSPIEATPPRETTPHEAVLHDVVHQEPIEHDLFQQESADSILEEYDSDPADSVDLADSNASTHGPQAFDLLESSDDDSDYEPESDSDSDTDRYEYDSQYESDSDEPSTSLESLLLSRDVASEEVAEDLCKGTHGSSMQEITRNSNSKECIVEQISEEQISEEQISEAQISEEPISEEPTQEPIPSDTVQEQFFQEESPVSPLSQDRLEESIPELETDAHPHHISDMEDTTNTTADELHATQQASLTAAEKKKKEKLRQRAQQKRKKSAAKALPNVAVAEEAAPTTTLSLPHSPYDRNDTIYEQDGSMCTSEDTPPTSPHSHSQLNHPSKPSTEAEKKRLQNQKKYASRKAKSAYNRQLQEMAKLEPIISNKLKPKLAEMVSLQPEEFSASKHESIRLFLQLREKLTPKELGLLNQYQMLKSDVLRYEEEQQREVMKKAAE